MRSKRIVIILIAVLLLMVIPAGARADNIKGAIIVSQGGHHGWQMSAPMAGEVNVNITVVNGSNVNFFVVDEENYQLFEQNRSFTYFENVSAVNSTHLEFHRYVSAGTYYIIVDNSEFPNGTSLSGEEYARPTSNVLIEYQLENDLSMDVISSSSGGRITLLSGLLLFGSILFLGLMLYMNYRLIKDIRRKKKK